MKDCHPLVHIEGIMKTIGSCHCQSVKVEVETDLTKGMECNCSICIRRGHILSFVPASNFKLLTDMKAVTDYQWGKKSIHFYFCSTCGIAPFGKGLTPDGEMYAVNMRCLENVDLSKIEIEKFDGKHLL